MVCKNANLVCKVGPLTLTLMLLLGNFLPCCHPLNTFDLKSSKVVQKKLLIHCGESCMFLVCVDSVIFELLLQVLLASYIDFQPGVHMTGTQHQSIVTSSSSTWMSSPFHSPDSSWESSFSPAPSRFMHSGLKPCYWCLWPWLWKVSTSLHAKQSFQSNKTLRKPSVVLTP